MKYLYSNVIGSFVFDNQFNLVERVLFKGKKDYFDKDVVEKRLKKKYRDAKEVPIEKLNKVLSFFKDEKYFDDFYFRNSELTKLGIKKSVSEDVLIIQAISNFSELNKMSNILVKRLREWFAWYLPEFLFEDNEKFVEVVLNNSKKELLKEIKLKEEDSMGADFAKQDVDEMLLLGREILRLYELRRKHLVYLERIMKKYCPNLFELAGATIGAKLLELSRGLKRLALLPASTVQLLGAEKALFRHIKTGSKSPKYGVIINHTLVQNAARKDKGRAARILADKLSLCARLDYFKGEFKAKEYRKELEKKLR